MPKKKAYLIHAVDKTLVTSDHPAFPFPVLGITTAAALFPADKWKVQVVDEYIEPVDLDIDADFVGISTLTLNAPHAYELADHFRSRWIPVLMGGLHVTYELEEALKHCDAVVLGEAEGVMPRVLADFDKGVMKRSYFSLDPPPGFGNPHARRDSLRRRHHRYVVAAQATRGCPHHCEFCSVPLFFGNQYRRRPVQDIVTEIKELLDHHTNLYVFFVDDNIGGTPEYAKELFRALIPLKIRWASFASLRSADDPKLLDLAAKSGCTELLIGFESLEQVNLSMAGKFWVRTEKFVRNVGDLHRAGIIIQASFIFGHDGDTRDIFPRTVEFVQKSGIEIPVFAILTPYPGTLLRRRLIRERRLLPDNDWRKYDGSHVLFRPALMTPSELQEGYFWAKKYCSAPRSIISRLCRAPLKNFPLGLLLNFSMWRDNARHINTRWQGTLRSPTRW